MRSSLGVWQKRSYPPSFLPRSSAINVARRSKGRAQDDWRPIRATAMWRVDQIFLQYSGNRIEVLLSLVNDTGDLRNTRVVAPTADPAEAVRFAARFIGGQGNVSRGYGVRIRWTRAQAETEQNALLRDRALEDIFVEGLDESLDAIRDQMR